MIRRRPNQPDDLRVSRDRTNATKDMSVLATIPANYPSSVFGSLFPRPQFCFVRAAHLLNAMANHSLGPIQEYVLRIPRSSLLTASRSGLSDAQPSPPPADLASPAETDEEEVFTYPADDHNGGDERYDHGDEEEFVYPDNSVDTTIHPDSLILSDGLPEHPSEAEHPQGSVVEPTTLVQASPSLLSSPLQTQIPSRPSPAQLEALSAAASQGDLVLLKKLFATALQSGNLEAFALANDASSRTGFTALHAAASRGYLDIVKWREFCVASRPCATRLIMSCQSLKTAVRCQTWKTAKGRLVRLCSFTVSFSDIVQTALHKAALNGHMSIIQYLLANRADVHARDADGWTPLHNTCSKVTYPSNDPQGIPHPFSRGILTLFDGSVKAAALRLK